MTLRKKFEYITSWFTTYSSETTRHLLDDIDKNKFVQIEDLINEKLPTNFKNLYTSYNGEEGKGIGSFLGHAFLSLEEILSNLDFSKSLIKTQKRIYPDSFTSKNIIHNIVETSKRDIHSPWHQLVFTCSPNSISGPYLYPTEKTKGRDKLILNIDNTSKYKIMELCKSLQEAEKNTYNWDELHFTIFENGIYQLKRTDFNFDTNLKLSSYPKNAIRKKYFHLKWIPFISDYGGNFIGIDLDPDSAGKKGQIIVYGRDEEIMFVLADSLESFFDLVIEEINKTHTTFLQEIHLHEILKEKIVQKVHKT